MVICNLFTRPHGRPFYPHRGAYSQPGSLQDIPAKITKIQAYLRDLWVKASDMHAAGIDAATAAETLDMTNHSGNFAQIRAPGVNSRAINRIFSLLDARAN